MPADIRAYLEKNGWSFSKKMCEFAVSRMKDRDGKKIEPITKEQIAEEPERATPEYIDMLMREHGFKR